VPADGAHGLSAYDASYLELATRERVVLATLGERLKDAAHAVGVTIFS
jgi:predicted nucleic acid-binding protein